MGGSVRYTLMGFAELETVLKDIASLCGSASSMAGAEREAFSLWDELSEVRRRQDACAPTTHP